MEQDKESWYALSAYQPLFDLINETGKTPTVGQMQDIIHLVHRDHPMEKTYTEKQLVDFGNYLLSQERFNRIYYTNPETVGERMRVVHQEDIDNAFGESN